MATVLFTRWFQSSVFSPAYRPSNPGPDAWLAPAPTQRALGEIIRLRARLEPYIDCHRSEFTAAGSEASVRALAASPKDYARSGARLRGFFFGPRLWVQPVPVDCAETVPVALPAGADWFDFWAGAVFAGEQTVRPGANVEVIPLYVRAGTILPLAIGTGRPGEAAGGLELRVYPGANASLTLPAHAGGAEITVMWDERARELRFKSSGGPVSNPDARREFQVVLVGPGRGAGAGVPVRPDHRVVLGVGQELDVRLPAASARPPAPSGLAVQIKAGRAVFTWRASASALVYRLKRTRSPGLDARYEEVVSGLLSSEHSSAIAALGSGYHYVVTASNAVGEGPPSTAIGLVFHSDAADRSLAPSLRPISPVASTLASKRAELVDFPARMERSGGFVRSAGTDSRREKVV